MSLSRETRAFASDHMCLSTPIFLGHGKLDEKVNVKLGEEAASVFSSMGMQVSWKSYPDLGHWYKVPEEIDDIVQFIHEKVEWDTSNVANDSQGLHI